MISTLENNWIPALPAVSLLFRLSRARPYGRFCCCCSFVSVRCSICALGFRAEGGSALTLSLSRLKRSLALGASQVVCVVPPSLSVVCSLRLSAGDRSPLSLCVCVRCSMDCHFFATAVHSINLRLMLCVWRGGLLKTRTHSSRNVARVQIPCVRYGASDSIYGRTTTTSSTSAKPIV